MKTINIKFPKGQIITTKDGKYELKYNQNYVNEFNDNMNKTQMFLDNKVIMNLQEYVSYKTRTQEASIRLASEEGSGYVTIGVPYAEYQAYSKTIHKKVGKRGTRPFERMKADKSKSILRQVAEYSRRING